MNRNANRNFAMRRAPIVALAAIVCAGCTSVPEPDDTASVSRTGPLELSKETFVGFRLGAMPQMSLGPSARSSRENGLFKISGEHAVLGQDEANGATMLVPNADAPKRRPFGASLEEHGEAVREFYLAAGLDATQVSSAQGLVGGSRSARSADDVPIEVGPVEYYSVLNRQIEGIPVPDSFAWAQLAEDGTVIAAGAYWPPIPKTKVLEAKAFAARIASPVEGAQYMRNLPPIESAGPPGQVSVRHSSFAQPELEPYVVYDIVTLVGVGRTSVTRHFDANGAEVRLPQERENER
jgi:hypothetical protein